MNRSTTAVRPVHGRSDAAPGRRSWRWWRELALVVVLHVAYDLVQGAITGKVTLADHDGWRLLHAEQAMHLDPELTLNRILDGLPVLAVLACYLYPRLHFIVTPAVLVWVCRARPAAYRSARAVLVLLTTAALLGFWLFPTAPPRLLPHADLQDTLAIYSNWGWWGEHTSVPAVAHAMANQYAAMPSLHVAWAAWSGVTLYRLVHRWPARVLALGYPIAMGLVVIATANHYLLDVLAGLALWIAAEMSAAGLDRLSLAHRVRRVLGRRDRLGQRVRRAGLCRIPLRVEDDRTASRVETARVRTNASPDVSSRDSAAPEPGRTSVGDRASTATR